MGIDNMTETDKYRQFRNFMFNDLGITKEDIRLWVREAVAEQASKMVANEFDSFNCEEIAREEARKLFSTRWNGMTTSTKEAFIRILKESIEIKVKDV